MSPDQFEDGQIEAIGTHGPVMIFRRQGTWLCEDHEVQAVCETLARWVAVRNSTCPEFGIPELDYVAQHLPGRILARGKDIRQPVHECG